MRRRRLPSPLPSGVSPPAPLPPRGPFREAFLCGLRQRCPNCGRGPMFRGWVRMREDCPVCHLTYWPESGYYVGAMYLNFIVSFLVIAPVYLGLVIFYPPMDSLAVWKMMVIWVSAGVLISLGLMRPSYSFWLALDFWVSPWEAGKPPEALSR